MPDEFNFTEGTTLRESRHVRPRYHSWPFRRFSRPQLTQPLPGSRRLREGLCIYAARFNAQIKMKRYRKRGTQMLEIKRRTLMKTAAAGLLLSAAPKAAFAAPKRGGHIKIGLSGGSSQDTLDPANVLYDSAYLTMATARSNLTKRAANGEIVPDLAEKWEHSDDLKTWTFTIRQGVTFHSGKSLELNDIVASFNRHRGPDTTSPAKSALAAVDDILAEAPNKIIFKLKDANVDFPSILRDLRFVIVPSKDGKADVTTTDGTGPYSIESFEPGQRIRFKRNPNYWDKENVGFFDTAEVIIITDAAARMNALRVGQVDVANAIDLRTLDMLRRVKGITIDDVPSGRYYIFGMMANTDPFKDKNVRQAVKYSIDRKEMLEKILSGHGTLGNDHPIASNHPYWDSSLPQREYDPDKARYYLKQAGLTSLEIPLSVSEAAFQGANAAAALFAASASKAGVTINVTREPDDGYFENVWMKKPFTADYWTQQASADAQFTLAYSKGATWNETRFENDRFNELLIKARGTVDEKERAGMYHEMQQLVHDESGSVIPMFANYVWASKSKVKHQEALSSDGDLDGFRCINRWWFEE